MGITVAKWSGMDEYCFLFQRMQSCNLSLWLRRIADNLINKNVRLEEKNNQYGRILA